MNDEHNDQNDSENKTINQSIKSRTKNRFNQLLSLGLSKSAKAETDDSVSDKEALIEAKSHNENSTNVDAENEDANTGVNERKKKHKKKKKHHKKDQSKDDPNEVHKEEEKIELKEFKKDDGIKEVIASIETTVDSHPSPPDLIEKAKSEDLKKQHEDENIITDDNQLEDPSQNVSVTEISSIQGAESTLQSENLNVFGVLIHGSDQLRKSDLISQPMVKVHILDIETGKYLEKSSKDRCVTSFYESSDVDYILPILTKPFNVLKQRTLAPVWEEVIIFNENYSYILDKDSLLVFEIIDAIVNSSKTSAKKFGKKRTWNHICWGFLKLKGANGVLNAQKRLRLQLYKPVEFKTNELQGSNVFNLWKMEKRSSYYSTLYVTVKPIAMPQNLPRSLRSIFPTQEEKSNESILNEVNVVNTKSSLKSSDQPVWTRLPSQPCRIPNANHLSLKPSLNGCFVVRFSRNGKYLACGCQNEFSHPLKIYSFTSGDLQHEFGGHAGIIYEIDWSKNDKFLLSSSADCTVKIWDAKTFENTPIAVLPHPAFVYTTKFHCIVDQLIVSGCYDTIIRVWSITNRNQGHNSKLVQELEGHKSHVNSICFTNDGHKLYSADGLGRIIVWNAYFTEQPSKKGVARDWTKHSEIDFGDFKGACINHIIMHPSNHKLCVHTRNNVIKIIDLRVSTVTVRLEGFINYQELIRSCISACGSFVFSGSEDGHVHVWRCDTGEKVTTYTNLPYTCSVNTVCFHPHDNFIAFSAHGMNQPVIIYKYQFEAGDVSMNRIEPKLPKLKVQDTSHESTRKHVSFDTDINKSVKVKTAMNKMNSVLESSMVSHTDTSLTNDTDISELNSSIPPMIASPSTLSPHAFAIPALAAEAQKQFLNRTKDFSSQKNVKVTLSGKAKSPSFNFKVPATESVQWVKALYNYNAARSDELSFSAGESIKTLYRDSDSWWMGEKVSSGEQGFFPVNYVKVRRNESLDDK